jgi:hypothetical protein
MPANTGPEEESSRDIVIEPAQAYLPEYEKLTYSVRWLGMPVGVITASIKGIKQIKGRKAYMLEITAKTNTFASMIYKVDDRFISYMDAEGLYSLRHEVYRREGRYKKDAITDFSHTDKKAHFKNLIDKSEKIFNIPCGVQDTLSACYYFRLLPIGTGRKIEYTVCNNEEIYQLFGVAGSGDYIRLPRIGRIPAFHIQPYARTDGEEVKKGKVSGYFGADERRLPLLAVVQAPMFTEISVSLDNIEYRQDE